MVEPFLVFEGGKVESKNIEFPSVPVLLEGIRGKDEEDKGKTFEAGEFLEPGTIFPLVTVEGSDLVGDLVTILICLVDVVCEGGVLGEEVDDELECVGLKGVL